ncbi:MAG: VanZ family protein [Burkholderiales bacterium]
MRALGVAAGWALVLAIVWGSLTPSPPKIDVAHADKFEHLFAYGALMFWFAWLYRAPRTRLAYAVLWIALGVGLEFAQRATGYRDFEIADMVADALGVLLGLALSVTVTLRR